MVSSGLRGQGLCGSLHYVVVKMGPLGQPFTAITFAMELVLDLGVLSIVTARTYEFVKRCLLYNRIKKKAREERDNKREA